MSKWSAPYVTANGVRYLLHCAAKGARPCNQKASNSHKCKGCRAKPRTCKSELFAALHDAIVTADVIDLIYSYCKQHYIFVISGQKSKGKANNQLHIYNPFDNTWSVEELSSCNKTTEWLGCGSIGGKLVLWNARGSELAIRQETQVWRFIDVYTMPDPPLKLYESHGHLYAVARHFDVHENVYCTTPETIQDWKAIHLTSEINSWRGNTIFLHNEHLYMIVNPMGIHRALDASMKQWTKLPDLCCPVVALFATASVGDLLFVIANEFDNILAYELGSSCQVYDEVTNKWSKKAFLTVPRRHHTATAVDDQVYVIGGYSRKLDSYQLPVETYDAVADKWQCRNMYTIVSTSLSCAVIAE